MGYICRYSETLITTVVVTFYLITVKLDSGKKDTLYKKWQFFVPQIMAVLCKPLRREHLSKV